MAAQWYASLTETASQPIVHQASKASKGTSVALPMWMDRIQVGSNPSDIRNRFGVSGENSRANSPDIIAVPARRSFLWLSFTTCSCAVNGYLDVFACALMAVVNGLYLHLSTAVQHIDSIEMFSSQGIEMD